MVLLSWTAGRCSHGGTRPAPANPKAWQLPTTAAVPVPLQNQVWLAPIVIPANNVRNVAGLCCRRTLVRWPAALPCCAICRRQGPRPSWKVRHAALHALPLEAEARCKCDSWLLCHRCGPAPSCSVLPSLSAAVLGMKSDRLPRVLWRVAGGERQFCWRP